MKPLFSVVLLAFLVNRDSAPAQNLIPDPTFSSGVSAWTTRGFPSSTGLSWSNSAGVDGAPGFAQLTGAGGLSTFAARVCLPVVEGTAYSWGGFLRLSSVQDAEASFFLVFFSNSSCEGSFGLVSQEAPRINRSNSSAGVWYLTPGPDIVAPPTAASAAFEVILRVAEVTNRSVDLDNVYFGPQGIGPPAIPVSVPTLSGSALLLFAVVLAGAAVWHLTVR